MLNACWMHGFFSRRCRFRTKTVKFLSMSRSALSTRGSKMWRQSRIITITFEPSTAACHKKVFHPCAFFFSSRTALVMPQNIHASARGPQNQKSTLGKWIQCDVM